MKVIYPNVNKQGENMFGSNNWVVDGVKSSTGKPILCNDMHLAWNMPGIWYEAHLVVEDTGLNVYGFTLAGANIVIVGHNEYVAWGYTNVNYDVMDWYYYEEVDSDHYIHNGVIKEYTKRTYNIKVKDEGTQIFTVKDTVHGPVLNDFLGGAVPDSLDTTNIVLAPKWTGNNVTKEFLALYGYNHAQNRADFNHYDHELASTYGSRQLTLPIINGKMEIGSRENLYLLVTFGPRTVNLYFKIRSFKEK